ncbi:MAG: GTPase Era, partial [Clostridiales bacterium]|nr:GTPase Era [Clostridiales bacterium]
MDVEKNGKNGGGVPFRCGFVAIVGRPNVGKSTFLNRILGQKISIISDKPQTTRNSIRGIYNREDMQVVFIDTPGFNKTKYKLDRYMQEAAASSLSGADVVFYVADAASGFGRGEEHAMRELEKCRAPVFLILNKIDKAEKPALLPLIELYAGKYPFAEIVPLSAATGENMERLPDILAAYLPEGPPLYPEDALCDQPEKFLIAELVREQVLLKTREEVPHAAALFVESMEERPGGKLYLGVTIFVERDSQKSIIIGKGGQMLKQIGTDARR